MESGPQLCSARDWEPEFFNHQELNLAKNRLEPGSWFFPRSSERNTAFKTLSREASHAILHFWPKNNYANRCWLQPLCLGSFMMCNMKLTCRALKQCSSSLRHWHPHCPLYITPFVVPFHWSCGWTRKNSDWFFSVLCPLSLSKRVQRIC
jgi:hypothetical protein